MISGVLWIRRIRKRENKNTETSIEKRVIILFDNALAPNDEYLLRLIQSLFCKASALD